MFIFWFRKLKRSLRVCISNQQGWCPHFLHIESQVFRQLWSFYSVTRSHKYTKWQPWIERNLKVESNLKICMTNLSNSLAKNAQIWLWHVRTLRSSWSVFISWFCHLHAMWPLHDKLLQLYLTFCDPMHCSPPGSSVHGILQAWILNWVVIFLSRRSFRPGDWTSISRISFTGRRILCH